MQIIFNVAPLSQHSMSKAEEEQKSLADNSEIPSLSENKASKVP